VWAWQWTPCRTVRGEAIPVSDEPPIQIAAARAAYTNHCQITATLMT